MNEKHELIEVDEVVLVFAIQYALGRSSTAPTFIKEAIVNNVCKLKQETLYKVRKLILSELRKNEICDKSIWQEISEICEKEMSYRNK